MVDKDDFSGFAPLQPQVRHHRPPVFSAGAEKDAGMGIAQQLAPGPGSQQGPNGSMATTNLPLRPWGGGGGRSHASAALCIIATHSPNPPRSRFGGG